MPSQTGPSNGTASNGAHHSKTALKVVFGAMTLGKEGTHSQPCSSCPSTSPLQIEEHSVLTFFVGVEGARVHDVKDIASVLDVLQKHGHDEVDTARVYGASEELLGQINWKDRGIVMGTKLNPRPFGPKPYSHKKDDLKRGLTDSLQALQTDKVDLWYLHTPDVSVALGRLRFLLSADCCSTPRHTRRRSKL